MTMTREEAIEEIERRGISLDIQGCGCCGSPMIVIKIDGEIVIDQDSEWFNTEVKP